MKGIPHGMHQLLSDKQHVLAFCFLMKEQTIGVSIDVFIDIRDPTGIYSTLVIE